MDKNLIIATAALYRARLATVSARIAQHLAAGRGIDKADQRQADRYTNLISAVEADAAPSWESAPGRMSVELGDGSVYV